MISALRRAGGDLDEDVSDDQDDTDDDSVLDPLLQGLEHLLLGAAAAG